MMSALSSQLTRPVPFGMGQGRRNIASLPGVLYGLKWVTLLMAWVLTSYGMASHTAVEVNPLGFVVASGGAVFVMAALALVLFVPRRLALPLLGVALLVGVVDAGSDVCVLVFGHGLAG